MKLTITDPGEGPHRIAVTMQNGESVHGVHSIKYDAEVGTMPTLTIGLMLHTIEANGEATFTITHPVTGKLVEVKAIEFADGRILTLDGMHTSEPPMGFE